MNERKLFEACFTLAEHVMWTADATPIEKLPAELEELAAMTNKFLEIAKRVYFQVEPLPNGEDILIGAVHYLHFQAIPPLRGNYAWFHYSLFTILEICNPHVADQKLTPFYLSLQKGITASLTMTNKYENDQ